MARMALVLANIILKCSGSFLKPISVSTRDWVISWMKNTKSKKYHLKKTDSLFCYTTVQVLSLRFQCWELLVQTENTAAILPPPGGLSSNCNTLMLMWEDNIIYLLVQTLWWGLRCRTRLCLSAPCTFCPRCSCRRSQTLSETKKQHRLMWCRWKAKNRTVIKKKKEKTSVLLIRKSQGYWGNYYVDVAYN